MTNPNTLRELYDAASRGFHTSKSCGADGLYQHVSRFSTLDELQAFVRAWVNAMTGVREALATPQPTDATLYQWRLGEGCLWCECSKEEYEARRLKYNPKLTSVEWRALFATPQPTPVVDAWKSVSDALPEAPGWYVVVNYGSVEAGRWDGAYWHHTMMTRDLAMPSHWRSFDSIEKPTRLAAQPASDRLAQLEDQAEKARALVKKWRELVRNVYGQGGIGEATLKCADELAAIYKDPSHD